MYATLRETDAADTQILLRIIQSIPSPKAEPFKQWLAKVGYVLITTRISKNRHDKLSYKILIIRKLVSKNKGNKTNFPKVKSKRPWHLF